MSNLSRGLCASIELLSQTINSEPQPQFLQAPFHPNVIYENLKRCSLTVSQQQGYYAQMLGEKPAAAKVKTQKFKWKQLVYVEIFRYIL